MALRERDAAEIRAQIEQQSMAKLQGEMARTSNELAQLREKTAEKTKRIEAVSICMHVPICVSMYVNRDSCLTCL
jgi:hypothetical protein